MENLAEVVGGKLVRGAEQTVFSGISTDSRTTRAGELFVALKGANFDGHQFLGQVQALGAAGAVIAQEPPVALRRGRWPLVRVADTLSALGRFAAWHRRQTPATIIGLTGSAGKTTTKELIAHLLSSSLSGVKAPRSFNNAIGVPVTLLELRPNDRFAVIEVGTNAFGEIAALAAIARPDIGLVTCIGDAHLEKFGSRWGVAWEKGHLITALPSTGVAVLNADDPWCRRIATLAACRVVRFGCSRDADVRIEALEEHDDHVEFTISGQLFSLNMPGGHNAMNAAGAIAVARELGLSLEELAARIASFTPPPMRMQRLRFGSVTVIADEYNASPTSVSAALAEYHRVKCAGRKILVLGDMLELGAGARAMHDRVGRRAAEEQLDGLWTIGPLAQHAARGALRHGMAPEAIRCCPSTQEACEQIADWIEPNDTLLLKGSRGMNLERVLAVIERRWGAGETRPVAQPELFESFRTTASCGRSSEGAS